VNDIGQIELPVFQPAPAPDRELLARATEILRLQLRQEPDGEAADQLGDLLADPRWIEGTDLARVSRTFMLTPFETGILLVLAAIAQDPPLAAQCSRLQGSARTGSISFALAAQLLPNAEITAFAPGASLRHWQLIELVPPVEAACATQFRLDEQMAYFLAGDPFLDQAFITIDPDAVEHAADRSLVDKLASLIEREPADEVAVFQLCGEDRGVAREIAAQACEILELRLVTGSAVLVPQSAEDRQRMARRCSRNLALVSGVLLLESFDDDAAQRERLSEFVDHVSVPTIVSSAVPLTIRGRTSVRVDIPRPDVAQLKRRWAELLGDGSHPALPLLARTFRLDRAGFDAVRRLANSGSGAPQEDGLEAIWEACRSLSRHRLDDLAERVECRAHWDDLILPEAQMDLLRDLSDHVRLSATVFDDWKFDSKMARGQGVAVLFAGPSGTGKTLAAEVIANALRRDIFRVDLSQVISKYIGETEKNLSRIFTAAEGSGAILLFDEADAMFGKRSEVKDSHDRYANIEVSYLLQRMENYTGLSILTTNLRDALDKAFIRRLRFIVQFAYPGIEQRRLIWQRMLPSELPRGEIDFDALARFDLTGGAIRNVALAAAFLAARDQRPLEMAHLVEAATKEYLKLEKTGRARDTARTGQ
jgi:hypothetical protein